MKNAAQTQHENIAEERVVLGRLLHDPQSYWQVADLLRSFHFGSTIHQAIYSAIVDILGSSKKLSLLQVESRVGPEYDDGKSTMTLLTAMIRDAENGDLEGVDTIVDLWKRRAHIAELKRALKEAEKPEKHIEDLMQEHTLKTEDITVNGQSAPIRTIGQAAAVVMDYSRKANQSGIRPGFDTGLPSLDEILGRIHPTDLGVIGAARGDGKTLVATQMAQHIQQYVPVVIFEEEMRDIDLAARALAAQATLTGETSRPLSTALIESGEYDQFDLQALLKAREALDRSQLYIDDRPKLTIEQIYDRCRVLKRQKGIGVAIVDHLRLVRTGRKITDRFERMEYVSGEMKAIAKELEIAVIVLSQVTRMSQRREDNPIPVLSDLDGGGALEQDADWAVVAFRWDRWLDERRPTDIDSADYRKWAERRERHKDRIELHLRKGRRSKPNVMREFEFDGRSSLIREIEKSNRSF